MFHVKQIIIYERYVFHVEQISTALIPRGYAGINNNFVFVGSYAYKQRMYSLYFKCAK